MLKLLQETFAKDVLTVDVKSRVGYYKNSLGFNAHQLMSIYHNNHLHTLTNTLEASYATILRLVGKDFFNYIAREYIFSHPPKEAYLQHYGDEFSDFIRQMPACKNLPYLVDVAKLEHYYELCYHSAKESVFDFSKLKVHFSQDSHLKYQSGCVNINLPYQMSNYQTIKNALKDIYLFHSRYPVLAIWRLDKNSEPLNLDAGGDYVLFYKYQNVVYVMSLLAQDYDILVKMQKDSSV